MSRTTIAVRRRPRALFAGVLAMVVAASLGTTIRSVRSEAASASGPRVPTSPRAEGDSQSAPQPVATGMVPETSSSTSSTTTTATAQKTVTTTAPPAVTTTTTAGRRRSGSAAAPIQQQHVEAIADASGWDWRAAGVTFVVGFHPQACCHWGMWDPRSSTIYIGPTAFGTAERLRYVVLHETAHAWQRRAGPTNRLMGDYAAWGYTGAKALEAGADCIATLWGAARSQGHYWQCPDEALAVAARRLGRA